ncbi:imidazolonepropionase [Reinekea blandensis]|nr:imidazolonepropionase [Reinekea blandensis]
METIDGLIRNIRIATLNSQLDTDYGVIEDGCLAWNDGKILYVGPQDQSPYPSAVTTIDGDGCWLTPGLIDCHTHLVYAGNRAGEFEALRQGKSYAEIAKAGGGIRSTVTATRAADEADLFSEAAKRLQRLLAEGVTTVEIKSGYGLNRDDELKMLRVIRQLGEHFPVEVHATCLAAHAVPPEFHDDPEAYLNRVIDEILPAVAAENLATSVDVFCESIAFSADQTRRLFRAATRLGFKLKGHVEQLTQQGGTDVLCEFNALSADHIEFISEPQIGRMAEAGVTAVILPGAFYYLGEHQKPPIESLRAHQVPMAVATDQNPGSSPLSSLLTAANLACVLFGMTPAEAWSGMTRSAAQALGLGDRKGQLREGFDADLLLWDVDHPRQIIHEINRFRPQRIWQAGQERTHVKN